METLFIMMHCVGVGLSLDMQLAVDKATYSLQRQGCPTGAVVREVSPVVRNGRTYYLAVVTTKGGK